MPDASSFTKQKLVSVISASNSAAKAYGSLQPKPHSTIGTIQFKNTRAGQLIARPNNATNNTGSPLDLLNFSKAASFIQLNDTLRNSPNSVIPITNESLINYYNNIIGTIPSGTIIYALAGTNISTPTLYSLKDKYVLIPKDGIVIGGVQVTINVSGNVVVGGTQEFPMGSRISIDGVFVDFIVSGSPAIIVPIPVYDLNPINFDFVADFGNSFYVFFKDQLTTSQVSDLSPLPGSTSMPQVYPSPALSFSNISLQYNRIALKFRPTQLNKLNNASLTSPSSCNLEIRFKLNLPCRVGWAEILSSDNLTENHYLDLSTPPGSGSPGTCSYINTDFDAVPPYVFGFYPKLYDLVNGKDYYLVIYIKKGTNNPQLLKMEALYFYFAS